MEPLEGRRLPDTDLHDVPEDFRPGDYWKVSNFDLGDNYYPTNLTRTAWRFVSPDGNGIGLLVSHTVRENEDGTINVLPGDGSSNSILHEGGGKSWHGYVYNGVWTEV